MRDAPVRQALDRLDSALAILDADGTVVYANDAWAGLDVSGTIPAAVAVGEAFMPACDTVVDEVVAATAREQFEALLAGETDHVRLAYACPHGEALPRRFRLQGRPFTADDGEYVVVEHTERTDEHHIAQERDQRGETLADVATVVSHDLRSPITAARSWAELLETNPETDTEKIGRVVSALDRLNAMADAAVTLARETDIDGVGPVEVGRVARQAWTLLDESDSHLVVEELDPVLADESTLELLLEQLFRNALQHGTGADGADEQSTVTVRVGPLADGFYVADDGAGIPEGLDDNLFEPGITTGDGDSQVGLGLAIVERAAEAHGWTIALAESEEGARFEITGVAHPP